MAITITIYNGRVLVNTLVNAIGIDLHNAGDRLANLNSFDDATYVWFVAWDV